MISGKRGRSISILRNWKLVITNVSCLIKINSQLPFYLSRFRESVWRSPLVRRDYYYTREISFTPISSRTRAFAWRHNFFQTVRTRNNFHQRCLVREKNICIGLYMLLSMDRYSNNNIVHLNHNKRHLTKWEKIEYLITHWV